MAAIATARALRRLPQSWRGAAVVFVITLLLITAASLFVLSTRDTAPPADGEQQIGAIAEFACPAARSADTGPPADGSAGTLTPPNATAALLCIYDHQSDPMPLKKSALLTTSPAEVVAFLNALPAQSERSTCLAMGRDQFQIVLSYEPRQFILINVLANCGSVQRGDTVRRLTSLRQLLAFWPA
jgi:hypothetical protein